MIKNTCLKTLALALGAIALCLSLAAGAASSTTDDRFEQAKAAFAEASGSKDANHAGYVRAYALWSELANEGDTRALYHIGIMNMYGLGGAEFDRLVAVRNVRAAAEGGYPMAQSFMGFMSERSDGPFVDYVRTGDQAALSWWKKGAEGNHCTAVRRLARAYANGELGLEPNPALAAQWRAREADCDRN